MTDSIKCPGYIEPPPGSSGGCFKCVENFLYSRLTLLKELIMGGGMGGGGGGGGMGGGM